MTAGPALRGPAPERWPRPGGQTGRPSGGRATAVPAFTGNWDVFRAWMPACCSPLNGVTAGAVAPGSQPSLNGVLGLLNHTPRWYWCVGAKVAVPPWSTAAPWSPSRLR